MECSSACVWFVFFVFGLDFWFLVIGFLPMLHFEFRL